MTHTKYEQQNISRIFHSSVPKT